MNLILLHLEVLIEFMICFIVKVKGYKAYYRKLYDPLCLAIWISDDGCWAKPGVRIVANCFTYSEVELLVKILKNKFNLDCTIQFLKSSQRYSIYIKRGLYKNLKESKRNSSISFYFKIF